MQLWCLPRLAAWSCAIPKLTCASSADSEIKIIHETVPWQNILLGHCIFGKKLTTSVYLFSDCA